MILHSTNSTYGMQDATVQQSDNYLSTPQNINSQANLNENSIESNYKVFDDKLNNLSESNKQVLDNSNELKQVLKDMFLEINIKITPHSESGRDYIKSVINHLTNVNYIEGMNKVADEVARVLASLFSTAGNGTSGFTLPDANLNDLHKLDRLYAAIILGDFKTKTNKPCYTLENLTRDLRQGYIPTGFSSTTVNLNGGMSLVMAGIDNLISSRKLQMNFIVIGESMLKLGELYITLDNQELIKMLFVLFKNPEIPLESKLERLRLTDKDKYVIYCAKFIKLAENNKNSKHLLYNEIEEYKKNISPENMVKIEKFLADAGKSHSLYRPQNQRRPNGNQTHYAIPSIATTVLATSTTSSQSSTTSTTESALVPAVSSNLPGTGKETSLERESSESDEFDNLDDLDELAKRIASTPTLSANSYTNILAITQHFQLAVSIQSQSNSNSIINTSLVPTTLPTSRFYDHGSHNRLVRDAKPDPSSVLATTPSSPFYKHNAGKGRRNANSSVSIQSSIPEKTKTESAVRPSFSSILKFGRVTTQKNTSLLENQFQIPGKGTEFGVELDDMGNSKQQNIQSDTELNKEGIGHLEQPQLEKAQRTKLASLWYRRKDNNLPQLLGVTTTTTSTDPVGGNYTDDEGGEELKNLSTSSN